METEAARMLSASLALIALFGVGLSMGKIFSTWLESIARNPSVKDSLFPVGLLGFAITESIALFALLVALLILFK